MHMSIRKGLIWLSAFHRRRYSLRFLWFTAEHLCGPNCLLEDDPVKYKGTNPLLIPLLCGWERWDSRSPISSSNSVNMYACTLWYKIIVKNITLNESIHFIKKEINQHYVNGIGFKQYWLHFLTIKSFTYLTYLDQSIDRHVCKIKPAYKRSVLYRAPCARRLRNMYEVEHFLALADSNLTIDLFCFDPQLHVHKEFVPVKVHSILFSL